jgi:GntR family transcriptional regulator
MKIIVDADSGLAPWRQVHDQIARAIAVGALAEGTRLPPIRQLARDLGLAAGTVARAYRVLEDTGFVATARARGTTVTGHVIASTQQTLLHNAAVEFATIARELGVPLTTALDAVRDVYDTC